MLLSLFGLYQAILGAGVGFKKFFGVYSCGLLTFILKDFAFVISFIFGFLDFIFSLFGPYLDIFGVGVAPKKFVWA